MDSFELKISQCIERHDILSPGAGVVAVALSGGADSVALLSVLCEIGYSCVALHCNFHLRGAESDRDERFAAAVAERLGCPIATIDFDVEAYKAEHRVSTEVACRELRYEWFERKCCQLGAQAIAVAHHRDDNVETFMLNLLRGSGLAGLSAMTWRTGRIARPLLGVTRAEIEQYLAAKGLNYVTDSTNSECEFTRNRLRNVVIPAIVREFPDFGNAVARTIDNLQSSRLLYDQLLENLRARYSSGTGIDLKALVAEQPSASLILYEWLKPLGFNASQASDIVATADRSGRFFAGHDAMMLLDRGILRPVSKARSADEFLFEISYHPRSEFAPVRDPHYLYLDERAFAPEHRVEVRAWRAGDRMRPFGMSGSKKLSDIFTDAGIAVDDKLRIPVLTIDDEIVWVAGVKTSALYPVTDATERYIQLIWNDLTI